MDAALKQQLMGEQKESYPTLNYFKTEEKQSKFPFDVLNIFPRSELFLIIITLIKILIVKNSWCNGLLL